MRIPAITLSILMAIPNLSGLASYPTQEPTGGGSLVRDITGGADLIFRPPRDPAAASLAASGRSTPAGGKSTGGKKGKLPVKSPPPKQDQAIAKANAARSAPKPRYAEAEEQYNLAAKLAPTDARAYAGLGNVYVDQGRFAQAVESYQKALKLKPDYRAAYLPLAFSLARLNKYAEAIELYNKIIKDEPNNPEAYNNLSFSYNKIDRF
jgi:Flp pilus assembly protein TadD